MKLNSISEEIFSEIQCETPEVYFEESFVDADEELVAIGKFIKERTPHNSEIEIEKIKFLYTDKPKKEGSVYSIGYVIARSEIERAVDDRYDYIICLFYPVWKSLDKKNKTIQLDKLFCSMNTDVSNDGTKKVKKVSFDSKEYVNNMNHFGIMDVFRSSEIVNLATAQYIENEKEQKRNQKKPKANDGN